MINVRPTNADLRCYVVRLNERHLYARNQTNIFRLSGTLPSIFLILFFFSFTEAASNAWFLCIPATWPSHKSALWECTMIEWQVKETSLLSWSEVFQTDRVPYRPLCQALVQGILCAHTLLPIWEHHKICLEELVMEPSWRVARSGLNSLKRAKIPSKERLAQKKRIRNAKLSRKENTSCIFQVEFCFRVSLSI